MLPTISRSDSPGSLYSLVDYDFDAIGLFEMIYGSGHIIGTNHSCKTIVRFFVEDFRTFWVNDWVYPLGGSW